MDRSAGIILPIFSLPGNQGIGTMGNEAYRFIDFLSESGQTYWQVLPLGHTYNGSPYEVISSFAGNMYLIDMERLHTQGLIECDELDKLAACGSQEKINYKELFEVKETALRKAFRKIDVKIQEEVASYKADNLWLKDYALYNALNYHFKTDNWQQWDISLRQKKPKILDKYRVLLKDEIEFWYFVQYIFMKQWMELRNYANSKKVQFIGDIPFYVSMNSVDVWANPELFLMDEHLNAIKVAGCPPDSFNLDGQYWGYPVYNWEAHKQHDYDWWHQRIIYSKRMYDVVRLDHFIGFTRTWHIPADTKTVSQGTWVSGPGIDFFKRLFQKESGLRLIAEDLGAVDQDVMELRDKTGCLGMKVLLLGFDSREKMDYRPHTFNYNSIAYTTVHDTEPINGWFESAYTKDIQEAIRYLNLTEEEGYNWGMIRGCYSSVAKIAMIQLQDLLGYGSWSRMNVPPLLMDNWTWRLDSFEKLEPLKSRLYEVTKRYARLRK
ncbi:MAG TPA: 4-alpha-glucanotransferase [Lachnospiraceae bacterium]|nr:4-alpha-glucanotransferase [uncultured Lachnoclostridium sp.]HAU87622.1 4-alpha-glucanotransferase [Lachnospiraceae bacterium]